VTNTDKPTGPVAVTDDSFADDVLASSRPVLVDFWAPWCGPCQKVAHVLEEISAENVSELAVAKIDVDANPATARHYGVVSIPTLILFRGGEPIKRIVGAKAKAALLRDLAGAL
jgi:thioredoxin 1